MGGVLLNEARRVLVPAATHDEEITCMSARAVVPGRWWAHLVGALRVHPHNHYANDPPEKDRGPDERARYRREELPDAQGAHHGDRTQGNAVKRGRGRGRLARPRPTVRQPPRIVSTRRAFAGNDSRGVPDVCDCLSGGTAPGYTLIELMFVLGLVALLSAIAVPQMLGTIDRSRGSAAARFLAARLTLARTQATTWGRAVALRFEEEAHGIRFSVYQDGNRNGVQTADIQRDIDRQIEPAIRLSEHFPGVAIGLTPDTRARDPVVLGRTNLLSFSPRGTATSGTIYVRGRDGTQWAVRVLGATGRTRVLRYVPGTDEWANAF